jgi:hypothetical protein
MDKQKVWACILVSWLLLWPGVAAAGPLGDRINQFPHWTSPPPTQPAKGDLAYPQWFAGTWQVTSTLVELVAPFAPDLITPGFDSNRQYLNQPLRFPVRFGPQETILSSPVQFLALPQPNAPQMIADRAFNGLNIARAYLGDRAVSQVIVAPHDPNQQVTEFRDGSQLITVISKRAVEAPSETELITTELFQQIFPGRENPYLNTVEATTAYNYHPQTGTITADQFTAIYLSPKDPDYFKVGEQAIALYRYQLVLEPQSKSPSSRAGAMGYDLVSKNAAHST